MAGLVPAIHAFWPKRFEQIIPVGIAGEDETHLPRSAPMLDIVLALDGRLDVVKRLEIDETLQRVAFCKSSNSADAMLINATSEIACRADVKMPLGRLVRK